MVVYVSHGNGIKMKSRLLCPRCGTNLEYMAEAEYVDGSRTIIYFYRCPRCSYRIDDEVLVVKRNGSEILIKVVKKKLGFETTVLGLIPSMEVKLR